MVEVRSRLRGTGNWIKAEAWIQSSETRKIFDRRAKGNTLYRWESVNQISFHDKAGNSLLGSITLREGTLPFRLTSGKSVVIRYNPVDPTKFWVPAQLFYAVKFGAIVSLAALAVMLLVLLFRS